MFADLTSLTTITSTNNAYLTRYEPRGGRSSAWSSSTGSHRPRSRGRNVSRGTLYLHEGNLWGRALNVGGFDVVFADYPTSDEAPFGRAVVTSVTDANEYRRHTIDVVQGQPPNGSVAREVDRLWHRDELLPLHKHLKYWAGESRDQLRDAIALALNPHAPIEVRVAGASSQAEALKLAHLEGATIATITADPRGAVFVNGRYCGYTPPKLASKVRAGEATITKLARWGDHGPWVLELRAPRA